MMIIIIIIIGSESEKNKCIIKFNEESTRYW